MSNYDKIHRCRALITSAELQLQEARDQIDGLSPDGAELPAVITPTRFEDAYRGLARHLGGGHDYYDQWTEPSQASHRGYARAVLESAGFQVQERQP
ncbi:hypothetical protein [Nesterenkonia jeotgali]|uniref:Uncharacterized protein n=1 Tax=Nesterenkonia jeotgali TaxID=317018 RepID=A0A0W8IG56_9MICC|nr:hypothetical protein [Nesterenkonia jeotgali]KUG58957.1 hypothetical protein AVL63_02740 [Nesterenkonia jeotgali]